MSKVYKGFELMQAVDAGELSFDQRVNSLSSDYKNCTIRFVLQDIALNVMWLDFELIEEQQNIDIQGIEEYEIPVIARTVEENMWKDRRTINKLIKAVKQLDNKIKESK